MKKKNRTLHTKKILSDTNNRLEQEISKLSMAVAACNQPMKKAKNEATPDLALEELNAFFSGKPKAVQHNKQPPKKELAITDTNNIIIRKNESWVSPDGAVSIGVLYISSSYARFKGTIISNESKEYRAGEQIWFKFSGNEYVINVKKIDYPNDKIEISLHEATGKKSVPMDGS